MRATREHPSQRMFEASEHGDVLAERLKPGGSQTLEVAHPLVEGRGFNIVAGIEFGPDDESRHDGMLLLDLRHTQPHAANGKRYPFGVLGPSFETDTPFLLVNRDFDAHNARRQHGFQEIREGETVAVGAGHGDGRFRHSRDTGNLVFDISCANGIVQVRDLYSARGTFIREAPEAVSARSSRTRSAHTGSTAYRAATTHVATNPTTAPSKTGAPHWSDSSYRITTSQVERVAPHFDQEASHTYQAAQAATEDRARRQQRRPMSAEEHHAAVRAQQIKREAVDKRFLETIDDNDIRTQVKAVRERADYLPIESIHTIITRIQNQRKKGEGDDQAIFRQLSREYHPDANRDDPSAELTYKLITSLYDIKDKKFRYAPASIHD